MSGDTRPSRPIRQGRVRIAGATLALVAAAGMSTALAQPAQAAGNWPEPATCDEQVLVMDDGFRAAKGTKAYEYRQIRAYGGGYEIKYVWVWEMEVFHATMGLLPAGFAEKVCGGEWKPGSSNIG